MENNNDNLDEIFSRHLSNENTLEQLIKRPENSNQIRLRKTLMLT